VRGEVTLDDRPTPKVDKFKYLGSIIQQNVDIDEDINHCIKVGWQKWKYSASVVCDKRVPRGLKGKVYRIVVKPAVLYGLECWPLKKTQVQRLKVTEMRMLRWMCGYSRLDKIRNGVIRNSVGVAPIDDKLRESRLRWFGHVKRRSMDAPVRRCERINIPEGRRGRGRPKNSLDEVIRNDLKVAGLTEDMAQDRKLWRVTIKTVDCGESTP